jgi:hypothetical protein
MEASMHPEKVIRPVVVVPDLPAPTSGDTSEKGDAPSHVRLKPIAAGPLPTLRGRIECLEAEALLDELCEDQLTLSMNLSCLERASLERPRDLCAQAALRSIDARLFDLRNVRDALALAQMAAWASTVHRALLPSAPFADYLRGVYAWMHAVVRALDDLVSGLRHNEPAWSMYRWRIEEAKNFHFDELEDDVRADFAALVNENGDEVSVARLTTAFNALLKHARILEHELDKGLG